MTTLRYKPPIGSDGMAAESVGQIPREIQVIQNTIFAFWYPLS